MRVRLRQTCAVWMLASACAHEPVADRIAEHDRVRESWVQTVRFVGLEWSRHAIPNAFAERSLARAREELVTEKKSILADRLPGADRERLDATLDSAIAFTNALGHTLSSSDGISAARIAEREPRPNADSLLRQAALK